MNRWLSIFLVLLSLFMLAPRIIAAEGKDKNSIGEYYVYGVMKESLPANIIFKKGDVIIQGDTAYFYLERISFAGLYEGFNLLRPFKINKIVIDLFSFGGSIFDGMAMASLITQQETKSKIVEIRARGLVASAGLIILVSGTKGHRYIHPISMVMFHELKSLTIAYDSPSDKEEAAKIERFIQDQVNQYIVGRSKISIQELRERIQRRDFWMDSKTAIQYGFADKLL